MDILLVAVNYAPDTAGNAGTVSGQAEYLVSQGHRVRVLTGFPYYPEWRIREGYRGQLWMREWINGVDVHRRWQYAHGGTSVIGRMLLEASFSLTGLSALTLPRPDVILSAIPPLSAGVVAAALAARFQRPLGLFVQDLTAESARQGGVPHSGRVARAVEWMESRVTRRAGRVAIIAEGFRAPLEAMGVAPSRIDFVPNWTATEEPTVAREVVRARLGLPDAAFVALHAGNMGYKQGLHVVLDAAEAARAGGLHEFLFLFVGDGAMRAELESRVQAQGLANVRFIEFQDRALYASMLGAADVLLLTQRGSVSNMSLPSKAASYMASGRPIIVSAAPESEIARDLGRIGAAEFAVPEDGADLLATMRRLQADLARAAALGARGQQYAREHHTPAVLGAELDRFIERVLTT